MKRSYDIIFSIGEACLCTQVLRRLKLQNASYPFDWLFGGGYMGRCGILADKLAHFIDREDLEYVASNRSASCDAYKNKRNRLIFNHDFAIGMTLDETYVGVREKYDRRIARLLHKLEKAKQILLVYIEVPLTNAIHSSREEIQTGYEQICHAFPGKMIDLLYIRQAAGETCKENLDPHITLISGDYKSKDPLHEDWVPDLTALVSMMPHLHLKVGFTQSLMNMVRRICISLIPFKKKRRELRKRYHV